MEKKKLYIDGKCLRSAMIEKEGIYKGCLCVHLYSLGPSGEISPHAVKGSIPCYFKNIYDNEYELVYAYGSKDELNDIELLSPQGGCGQVLTIKKIKSDDPYWTGYYYVFEGKNYLINRAICYYQSKRGIMYYIKNSEGSYKVYKAPDYITVKPTKEIKENVILI